jgi:hypothetical protein
MELPQPLMRSISHSLVPDGSAKNSFRNEFVKTMHYLPRAISKTGVVMQYLFAGVLCC